MWNELITCRYFYISITKPGTGFGVVDKDGPCPQGVSNLVTRTGIHQLMRSVTTITKKKTFEIVCECSMGRTKPICSVWVLHL